MSNPRPSNSRQFAHTDFYSAGAAADSGQIPLPSLIDPAIVRAARQIYRQFYEAHPEMTQRPVGVALNRYNYRGKLIFGKRPILLPEECFVPLEQVQSELY
ncbi:MAG: hypothetical protein ACO3NK_01690 [Prochlorotrichaceae cyanobacterium]|jgi:hypothetical protein